MPIFENLLFRSIYARSNHLTIIANQEIASQNRINQLQVALLQIENQKSIENNKLMTTFAVENNRLVFQEKMAALGFERQESLEEFKFELNKELKKLDHSHQLKIENFKKELQLYINQDNQKFQAWRLQKEHEYRMEREVFYMNFQQEIAAKNRENAKELAHEKKFFDDGWPLKNIPSIYTSTEKQKLNIFISAPTISDDDVNNYNFPKIEGMLTYEIEKHLLPFYGDYISVNDGGWLSKKYHGNSALKPLAVRLKYQSFMAIESSITKLEDDSLLSLRFSHKMPGEEDAYYQTIINNFSYKQLLAVSAIERALVWEGEKKNEKKLIHAQKNNVVEATQKNLIKWREQQTDDYDYNYDSTDWKILVKFWSFFHVVVISWKIDAHLLIREEHDPQFPKLLKRLISDIPAILIEKEFISLKALLQDIVVEYKLIFGHLLIEKAAIVPNVLLTLVDEFLGLPEEYKFVAYELLTYCIEVLHSRQIFINDKTYYFRKEEKQYLENCLRILKEQFSTSKLIADLDNLLLNSQEEIITEYEIF